MNDAFAVDLECRKRWALALIAELVNTGRREGWLVGEMLTSPSARSMRGTEELVSKLLRSQLDLGDAAVDALWLLACIELEPVVACAAAQLFIMQTTCMSLQILERLVGSAGHRLDDHAISTLVDIALVEIGGDYGVPRYQRAVRATDRVIGLMRGDSELDRALKDVARLEEPSGMLLGAVPTPYSARVRDAMMATSPALVIAHGTDGVGRAAVLRQACALSGHRALVVEARSLKSEESALVRQLRAIRRESLLHDAVPLIRNLDVLPPQVVDRELMSVHDCPILATADVPLEWHSSRSAMWIEISSPSIDTGIQHWQAALPGVPTDVLRTAGQRYSVSPRMIRHAAAGVTAQHEDRSNVTIADVHLALRTELQRRLCSVATRIETRQTWDDLVLPIEQFDTLLELTSRVRNRKQVLDDWGFADKVGRGHGVAALFSGPPGTGKTMIAGLLANELGLDLYQVDLSRIVSKYLGETEKHLAAVFEAAESGQAIVLFDEADSLFGKRTEVKSSNDRYANLEVNYLLQRMEQFRGITVLTTNHESAIDDAFKRRLALHVRIPMPDEAQRELLWRAMIPAAATCSHDIDVAPLAAEFVMTGGYIKNAVLRAAYMAAAEFAAIGQKHLERAARAEYEAMGKLAYRHS